MRGSLGMILSHWIYAFGCSIDEMLSEEGDLGRRAKGRHKKNMKPDDKERYTAPRTYRGLHVEFISPMA